MQRPHTGLLCPPFGCSERVARYDNSFKKQVACIQLSSNGKFYDPMCFLELFISILSSIVLKKTLFIYIYIYIHFGSKRSLMHVVLKMMAHLLLIIFYRVFSNLLNNLILEGSLWRISLMVLKDGRATFRFS